jgi:EAL domain-containing protein (putative c-di-GMP-specific phosphodiesterase class I)
LAALEDMNVRLAIDDFGTGYCTLVCLKRFPVHTLKIDRSFVKEITKNQDDAAIASAVVALAHSLGLQVVAEGVELEEHREFLTELSCDYMQGYFVSRPIPLAELFDFIVDWNGPALEVRDSPSVHPGKYSSNPSRLVS